MYQEYKKKPGKNPEIRKYENLKKSIIRKIRSNSGYIFQNIQDWKVSGTQYIEFLVASFCIFPTNAFIVCYALLIQLPLPEHYRPFAINDYIL